MLFKGAQPLETVPTGRLRLTKEVVNVPLSVTDSGGGLSLGPEGVLLLMDRRGGFFSVTGDQVEKLDVTPPPTNRRPMMLRYSNAFSRNRLLNMKGPDLAVASHLHL